MLLESPALVSTAVTGPGKSPSLPNLVQVLFPNENSATLAEELSGSRKDPEATSGSWLLWEGSTLVTEEGYATA